MTYKFRIQIVEVETGRTKLSFASQRPASSLLKVAQDIMTNGASLVKFFQNPTNMIKDVRKQFTRIPTDRIIDEVCLYYRVSKAELLSDKRTKELAFARQVAMFCARQLTADTMEKIGTKFNREHGTVIYACEQVRGMIAKDPAVKEDVVSLLKSLDAGLTITHTNVISYAGQ